MFLNLQTYSTQYEFSMLVMILLTPGWGFKDLFYFIFYAALHSFWEPCYTVVVELMCGLI